MVFKRWIKMEQAIQKIFRLLESSNQTNWLLAKQLIESQGFPSLFEHKGGLCQAKKLECLQFLEQHCSVNQLGRVQFWRLFSICNECFDFVIKESSWYNEGIEVFVYPGQDSLKCILKLDAVMWSTQNMESKIQYLNSVSYETKKRLAKELQKPVWLREGDVLRGSPLEREWVVIAKKASRPIDYWVTPASDYEDRLHINIYFEAKLKSA